MFTSLNRLRRLPLLFSVVLLPSALSAQNAFSPGGPEYPVLGALPGEQTAPAAAVNAAGGWLVWQDNATDTNGLGVSAWRLDTGFRRSGSKLRVNVTSLGDQEKPQVALLTNGTAVFVWQGGKLGFQKIYTRFLTAAGTFLTTNDVLVNTTYTNQFQISPAVAALANGGAVVAWSSFGQDGSLQGIFARRYNANGTTNGGVFQLNQFALNNQRSPAVAALPTGGFVAAWVSELQRGSSSVDIYARLFDSAGNALGNEFVVNTSTTNACANPSIAVLPGGQFAVAWSQREFAGANSTLASFDTTVVTPRSANSWDVFARAYSAAGIALGSPARMNSYTYGDQYAPKLAAFGQNYLATWLSLGQDGSQEGIFGQFLNASAAPAGVEFRVNTANAVRQLDPTVATDGLSRFLVLWSSYASSGNFDLFGRVYDLIQVSIAPIAGGARVSWNTVPGLTYQLQVSTDYVNWTSYGASRVAAGYSDSVDVVGGPAAAYRVVRVP